jgi:hypothetical protein
VLSFLVEDFFISSVTVEGSESFIVSVFCPSLTALFLFLIVFVIPSTAPSTLDKAPTSALAAFTTALCSLLNAFVLVSTAVVIALTRSATPVNDADSYSEDASCEALVFADSAYPTRTSDSASSSFACARSLAALAAYSSASADD